MYFLTYIDRVKRLHGASSIKEGFGLSNTAARLFFSGFAYPYVRCSR